jgi:hypothetical protein
MIDIQEFEEGVLIEADYYNYSIGNLVNDIEVRNRNLETGDLLKIACNVIAALWIQGFITVVRTEYRQVDEEACQAVSVTPLNDRETEDFLRNSENWKEMEIFSETLTYELEITDAGRRYLEEVVRAPR